jgi:hypothetical protein
MRAAGVERRCRMPSTDRKLCTVPSSLSLATGEVTPQSQLLTAKFEANDFERRWNAGRLDNGFIFELFYLRREQQS